MARVQPWSRDSPILGCPPLVGLFSENELFGPGGLPAVFDLFPVFLIIFGFHVFGPGLPHLGIIHGFVSEFGFFLLFDGGQTQLLRGLIPVADHRIHVFGPVFQEHGF